MKSEDRPQAFVPRAGNFMSAAAEIQQLGIDSLREQKRYTQVAEAVGVGIAEKEIAANLAGYEREFLRDEPVSLPHPYFHLHNELYSQQIDHPLFNIKNQIDARERDGLTFKGFKNFEKMINASTSNDEVFLWYSPAGKGGNTPPFDKLFFDSGRLYLAFKGQGDISTHFDIKTDESRFPVVEFLDHVNQYNGKHRPVGQDNDQGAKYHYLEHPIRTGANSSEFFSIVNDFLLSRPSQGEEVAYVSRRESATPRPHTLKNLFGEVQEQYIKTMTQDFIKTYERSLQTDDIFSPTRQEDIRELYYLKIAAYMRETGTDTVTLYGCSTTSTVSKNGLFRQAADTFLQQFSVESFMSAYSSDARILTSPQTLESILKGPDYMNDPDLCQCGSANGPHFHCPGGEGGSCGHAIVVGKGISQCPSCGAGKVC